MFCVSFDSLFTIVCPRGNGLRSVTVSIGPPKENVVLIGAPVHTHNVLRNG